MIQENLSKIVSSQPEGLMQMRNRIIGLRNSSCEDVRIKDFRLDAEGKIIRKEYN